MNALKVGVGYGGLVAGILLAFAKHFNLPVTEDQINYLSGVFVMLGGGLLHLAQSPFKK